MENLILDKIEVKDCIVKYKFSYTQGLSKFFTTNEMFVRYDSDVSSLPESILAIPFVGSLIGLTWLTNSIMWVTDIDETFYSAVRNLKLAYQELYPHYKFGGRFVAAKITKNQISDDNQSSAVLLFSGGVDAQTSFVRNLDKNPMLCNIQGWYHNTDETNSVADNDKHDIADFANRHNCKCALIDSNFATIVNVNAFQREIGTKLKDSWWHGIQHSMAFISLSIPIAFTNGYHQIIIASSFTIGDSRVCASYPTTDNEFKFADKGYTTHDGFELTRQDKIKVLVEHQKRINKTYPIRVCSFNDHNCCKCEKCFRTVLAIIAEGGNPELFDFHFDKPIAQFYKQYIKQNIALFGVHNESLSHWPHIKKRMIENYDNIQEKELVEWFLNYDFHKEKRKGVIRYYYHNFFSILKRKIKGWLSR